MQQQSILLRMITAVCLAASNVLLLGCAHPYRDSHELTQVWNATWVYFPSSPSAPVRVSAKEFQEHAARLEPGRRYRTVIFLHGCSGFHPFQPQANIPYTLASNGYIVFVPDSFARGAQRKQACRNVLINTVELRRAEVESTFEHLMSIAWVDARNLYLAGHSEGGITTAMYGKHEFAAYFLSGWTCTSVNPEFDRIHAPRDRPFLAAIGAFDEYHPDEDTSVVNCGTKMRDRPRSRSVVVSGGNHDSPLRNQKVLDALVLTFDGAATP